MSRLSGLSEFFSSELVREDEWIALVKKKNSLTNMKEAEIALWTNIDREREGEGELVGKLAK